MNQQKKRRLKWPTTKRGWTFLIILVLLILFCIFLGITNPVLAGKIAKWAFLILIILIALSGDRMP